MVMNVKYSNFNLHIAGLTADGKQADLPDAKVSDPRFTRRVGSVASAALILTDPNRNFTTDGVTTSHRVKIFTDTGNVARDVAITAVGTTTITVGGANFDTSLGVVNYRVYLSPTGTQIVNDLSLRGEGIAGFQELLAAIETLFTVTLETVTVDLSYHENLTQQVLVFDDGT